MRALALEVYRHDYHDDYDPTNGGVSSRYDEILVPCENGPREVNPETTENLFRIDVSHVWGTSLHLVPYNTKRKGMVGPMFGGNYATASDSRWGKWLAEHYGNEFRFNNCLPIHDRYETPEMYEILSR